MFGRDEDAILYRVRKKDLSGDSLIRRNRYGGAGGSPGGWVRGGRNNAYKVNLMFGRDEDAILYRVRKKDLTGETHLSGETG